MTVNYSLSPNAQPNQGLGLNASLSNFSPMTQAQVPGLDYSWGQQNTMSGLDMGGAQGLQAPNYGSIAGFGGGSGMQPGGGLGLGMNMPTLALGLQGLNSLGSLYMGAKSLSLANKQFASTEKFANANLANQTHMVNDTLQTRINRIGSGNGTSAADMAAEYERRKLPTRV